MMMEEAKMGGSVNKKQQKIQNMRLKHGTKKIDEEK